MTIELMKWIDPVQYNSEERDALRFRKPFQAHKRKGCPDTEAEAEAEQGDSDESDPQHRWVALSETIS